ncbi:hypothetical protein H8B06_01285 [Sphingobacterium sp. DN00404]|uniref:Uncharacterized protein n=1 Tax=Sphingobacterium micropteri TaxID=2763501 RepID=A0ABR7YJS5_9SPHI|nr:hypothetical protein [Sphingobacterium micropteri]MBD1431443.1 hypothetical protein [Sphingobacterium micropteri]
MKYLLIFAIALASCTGSGNSNNEESEWIDDDTVNATVHNGTVQKSYCFIRTEGADQQDTTTVKLIINADKVEGEMNWIPKEKDRRKGVLVGTITGDEITAVWRYMQEGMNDSMAVAFKFAPDQLAQKPLKVNTSTGVQETDERADYTLLYTPLGCDD